MRMLRVVEVIASTASQSSEAEARTPKPLTPSSPFFPVPHYTVKPAQRMLTERVASSAMIRREKVYCCPSVATSYRQLTGYVLGFDAVISSGLVGYRSRSEKRVCSSTSETSPHYRACCALSCWISLFARSISACCAAICCCRSWSCFCRACI